MAFSSYKADAFDTWDESRLREFLLEQGVVNPSGTREQLALLAKQKWRQYSSAASAYSKTASKTASSVVSQASNSAGSAANQASKSASSLASSASAQASTAVYGNSWQQASKSASSIAAMATDNAAAALDDSKDYVYST